MSTFKEYLAESKRVYNFKVKIAGEHDNNNKISERIKIALGKFDCTSVSKPKRTPISETPLDFPDQKYTHVSIFDVTCSYPTTSHEMVLYLAERLGINGSCIRVRSEFEERERNLNKDAYDRIGTKAPSILNKPLEDISGQEMVGEKKLMSFIKELGKSSHKGEQVKGINDQLLAKSAPTGSAQK
jgi:hypothetical protein